MNIRHTSWHQLLLPFHFRRNLLYSILFTWPSDKVYLECFLKNKFRHSGSLDVSVQLNFIIKQIESKIREVISNLSRSNSIASKVTSPARHQLQKDRVNLADVPISFMFIRPSAIFRVLNAESEKLE